MSVTLQHPHVSDLDVVVVSGIDDERALEHLCHSLNEGAVFDHAKLVVVDVTALPEMDDATLSALRDAAHTLVQRHQCLAVVDSYQRPVPCGMSTVGATYPDLSSALRAGRRYFRFVTGVAGKHTIIGDLTATAIAVTDTVVRRVLGVLGGMTRAVMRP